MSQTAFEHLVFDLDDTLLDTYRQLIPRATREACTAMISAGMNSSVEQCLEVWSEQSRTQARREVFSQLVSHFGVKAEAQPAAVAASGHHAFYNRRVEPDITLFPGTREMLERLKSRYTLHLVTAGPQGTQSEKIRILDLNRCFATIWHIDPARNEHKREAFRRLMRDTDRRPETYLSIGNRVDTDIAEARELGWRACWVRYGEHATMTPSTELETPDFIVDVVTDVEARCQL